MAYHITNASPAGSQPIAKTSTVQEHPLGTEVRAVDPIYYEGVFIYLLGVASTVVGSWVLYNPDDHSTTLLAANAKGSVAIAMSINVASSWGWYQIKGKAVGKALTGFADNADVYGTGTAGSIDDAVVSGDMLYNAKGASAVGTPSSGLAEFEIDFPNVKDGDILDSTAITASSAELNYNDIASLGTGAASKSVVLDGSGDYTYPATATIVYPSSATLTLSSGSTFNAAGTFQLGAVTQEAQLAAPTLATIDDTAQYDVGRVYRNTIGAEWVYIQGVASTIAGDWLHFTITSTAGSTTTRAVANGKGPLGVAVGALINTKFGWVQVAGLNLVAGAISGGDAAVGASVYLTGTAGLLDDAFVDGDMLFGAHWVVQEGETAGNPAALAGVWLAYPTTNDLDIVS